MAAEPALSRIAPLGTLLPHWPERTLLHAGPPLAAPTDAPRPLLHGALAAARHEGWADDLAGLLTALRDGSVRLAPAQDHGVVTPLAFVAGPSMFGLEATDAAARAPPRCAPLNDGPPPNAPRFGTQHPDSLAVVAALGGGVGDDLANALRGGLALLPLMSRALEEGDDLHGRVDAIQALVRDEAFESLSDGAAAYLAQANQFALNVVMAVAALMLAGAGEEPGSSLVVAAGGNGRDFGVKTAGGAGWIVRPALPPNGPRLPGREAAEPLPAIGDSAVIDALGLGAAALRFAPDLAGAFGAEIAAPFLTPDAHAGFLGQHPALPAGVHVGLDLQRSTDGLGITLGMVDRAGEAGLIGRGIAPWPQF